MAGATIDHMISVTILIAALLVAMLTYNGLFASAVEYDKNRQVANKAVDIINTICLSPGNPTNWGETNASLLGFGLQDPRVGGYAISPFSVMRLNTATNASQLVYYPGTNSYYNNVTSTAGFTTLTPLGDCINYTTAAELLGINGKYEFSIDINPSLNIEVTQIVANPLTLNIQVYGSSLPISGAALKYHLLEVKGTGNYPEIIYHNGEDITGSSGSVNITFSGLNGNVKSFSFTVYAELGGITGVGYYAHNTAESEVPYIIPLIHDYDNGIILIAHGWDIFEDPGVQAEVKYNATFYVLTPDFQLQPVLISNSTDHLNWGSSDYFVTQIPASETGYLVISYKKSAVETGTIIMPWGIASLGVKTSYSSGIGSSGYDFVATELRQVIIDGISYQVKVSVWSLSS